MKTLLFTACVFFAGLWFAYHFNLRKPVEKFDNVVRKISEELKNP